MVIGFFIFDSVLPAVEFTFSGLVFVVEPTFVTLVGADRGRFVTADSLPLSGDAGAAALGRGARLTRVAKLTLGFVVGGVSVGDFFAGAADIVGAIFLAVIGFARSPFVFATAVVDTRDLAGEVTFGGTVVFATGLVGAVVLVAGAVDVLFAMEGGLAAGTRAAVTLGLAGAAATFGAAVVVLVFFASVDAAGLGFDAVVVDVFKGDLAAGAVFGFSSPGGFLITDFFTSFLASAMTASTAGAIVLESSGAEGGTGVAVSISGGSTTASFDFDSKLSFLSDPRNSDSSLSLSIVDDVSRSGSKSA